MKDNEEIKKIEKYYQKNVRILYNSLCECVWVYVYVCAGYICVIMCGHISDI